MSRDLSFFILGIFLSCGARAGETLLSEESLLQNYRQRSVQQKALAAQKAATDLSASLVDEIYQPRLKALYNYSKSTEEGSLFQPTFSPQKMSQIGVSQKTPFGFAADLAATHSAMSTADGALNNDTTVGLKLGLSVDLWKNLFGSLDRAQIKSVQLQKKRGELEEKVSIKKSENEIRKIFWSLVAVDENLQLTQSLLSSAERQSKDAIARNASGVADKGEVAKYKSLVESRRGSLLLYEYEKEQLLGAIESLINDYSTRELQVAKVNDDQVKQKQIFSCIDSLSKDPKPNLDATYSDEILGLLGMQADSEYEVASKHADWDFGFQAFLQSSGRSNSFSDAFSELTGDWKNGYGVGLFLSVPLGSSSNQSEKALAVAKKMSLEAQKEMVLNQFKSSHITLVKGLKLLGEGLNTQKANSENLNINFNEMRTKFNQGRVPLSMLISEQDLLFHSRLQEIQLKKMIAHTLLDYFSVFTEYPCAWNSI
jgi:outer membrane protein TolC